MSLDDYEYLLRQLWHPHWGNVFQVALGGGETLEHPDFLNIIDATLANGIVPNFTTNGVYLTSDIIVKLRNKVGAIAVSSLDIETIDMEAIKSLKRNNIKCNIHYVLNHSNLEQAIDILKGRYNQSLQIVNSIVFLTYKPLGRADNARILRVNRDFITFISLVDKNSCSTRIGFDACFVPMLMHYTNVDLKYVDPCECAFFSVYIDEKLKMSPCSFSNNNEFTYSIKEHSIEYIWTELFGKYRDSLSNNCVRNCKNKRECRGRCPYFDEITMCYIPDSSKELSYAN
jgi:radical SAM protein with 4Fe4S-binding SPASM domain